jgi:hypothetical protein
VLSALRASIGATRHARFSRNGVIVRTRSEVLSAAKDLPLSRRVSEANRGERIRKPLRRAHCKNHASPGSGDTYEHLFTNMISQAKVNSALQPECLADRPFVFPLDTHRKYMYFGSHRYRTLVLTRGLS